MFGYSLIKTDKLKHLYREVSQLAIDNVAHNKEVAKLQFRTKRLEARCAILVAALRRATVLVEATTHLRAITAHATHIHPKKKKRHKR